MVTRSQLGHHATIFGMHGDLTIQGIGHQTALSVVDGDAGFVAGSLDAKNSHVAGSRLKEAEF